MKAKERNLGVDLLRVLCMLAIVVQHVIGHGWVMQLLNPDSWKYELMTALQHACMFGISGFALISGYVGVPSRYRYGSLALQWTKVLFYSVTLTALMAVMHPGEVGAKDWLDAFFPTVRAQYWYFSAYAGCFIAAPFVRMAMRRMNFRQATVMTALLIAVFSVGDHLAPGDTFVIDVGKGTLWLLVCYAVGGYFGWFRPHERLSFGALLALAVGSTLLAVGYGPVVSRMATALLGHEPTMMPIHNNSPRTVLMAVSLLLVCSRMKITRGRKLVSVLGAASFGVYLIHDHTLIRRFVISEYSHHLAGLGTAGILAATVLVSVLVYLACTAIDALREKLFAALGVKERIYALEERVCPGLWAD